RIDLHDERFGARHAARRETRAIRAGRDERTLTAEAAALPVAARRGRTSRVAQIPHEPVHADLRRQRRRQAGAAAAAAAAPRRRRPPRPLVAAGAVLAYVRMTVPAASRISSFRSLFIPAPPARLAASGRK